MKTPEQIQKDTLDYLEKRFGLGPENFKDHRLYLASRERVYLGPKFVPDDRKIVTLGILIARASSSIKPTTNLFQLFGGKITKNIIILDKAQTVAFAKGDDLPITDPQGATDGYVLLKYGSTPLGCGLLKAGNLKNMLPKAKRLEISFL
jgi:NOL1/NOP2/fmu family ribosome biogenesis protein